VSQSTAQASDPVNSGLAAATAARPQPSPADVAKALDSVEQATKNAELLRSAAAPQQRAWNIQALGDISGQNFRTGPAAWKNWYDGAL
jgi:hypothetical protein